MIQLFIMSIVSFLMGFIIGIYFGYDKCISTRHMQTAEEFRKKSDTEIKFEKELEKSKFK